MSSSLLSSNLTRSFGALLALLLFLVGFSVWNFRALSEANRWNIHTYEVINSVLELESTLFAVDSGARAFFVTGEPNALHAYRSNLQIYEERLEKVLVLVSDNPTQSAALNALDASKAAWIRDLIAPLIAQSRKLTAPDERIALAARTTLTRRVALQGLQRQADNFIEVEETLLAERTIDQQRVKWWTQFTLVAGGAFSVLLTAFLVGFSSKNARRLDQSNARLRDANQQLQSEVAARRLADEKLRRSVLDLKRSNAELEQFAYVASHDLQEPLRAVGGCVQVLQRRYQGQLDERAHTFIQHSVDGVQRMQNLINDLLTYSRVGTKIKPFEPVQGDQILRATLQSLSVAIEESGARIASDPLPVLKCDAGQIEQVLQNLLSNAIKFRGAEAPQIYIAYSKTIQHGLPFHVLSVKDDGLGIQPQYFERIFVMFQRLHTRTEYSGTGIGLAICKKIVERHGGKIWVVSWPRAENGEVVGGKSGSMFAFSLPFEPHEAKIDSEAETEADSLTAGVDLR